jgi:SAM-dependent methyltransferase
MAFTAHPIRLPDGTSTMPGESWDMSQHPVFVAARAVLFSHYRDRLSGRTVVDLGCLEGGYTVEFARLGMIATGIEVRPSNFALCEAVRTSVALPDLKFIQDDAWNVASYGPFDVVFCSGLLYHLANPRRYLELIAAATRDLLILDTHVALDQGDDTARFALGEFVSHEGMRGRWFLEYSDGADTRNDAAHWSAWGNARSFWPLKAELMGAIADAGFSYAFADAIHRPAADQRTMIIAFK